MSENQTNIALEIQRISDARDDIAEKVEDFGLGNRFDRIDVLATAIKGIANIEGQTPIEVTEGTTYTIPPGYHHGSQVIIAKSDELGDKEKYKLQSKVAKPKKQEVVVSPDQGYYGLSSVTVEKIPDAYQNVSSVNATASDVLAGKVIVTSDGTVTTGIMTDNGAVSRTLSGSQASYTIPAGYHNGKGEVKIVTQEVGNVIPTDSQQTITPSAGKVITKVTVAPVPAKYGDVTNMEDAQSVAEALLVGHKAIAKNSDGEAMVVDGEMPNNGAVSQVLNTSTTSYKVPAGYHNGSGTVSVSLEEKTTTPTKSQQYITPTDGKMLSKVTVDSIPDKYGDVKDTSVYDVLQDSLLEGTSALGKDYNGNSVLVNGKMPHRGAIDETLDTTNPSVKIQSGYHNGDGKVKIVLEEKEVAPLVQGNLEVTPTSGKVLSKVIVNPIPSSYGDVSGTTLDSVVESGLLEGYTVIAQDADGKSVEVTGAMPNIGEFVETLDTHYDRVLIPEGYHDGTGEVKIKTEEKNVTPSTQSQVIEPETGKVLSKVTVKAIPDKYGDSSLTDVEDEVIGSVLEGVKVIAQGRQEEAVVVTGAMPNIGRFYTTVDTVNDRVSIPEGYHDGTGLVYISLDDERIVTPTTHAQKIDPESGNVLSSVIVEAIPAIYGDATVTDEAGTVSMALLDGYKAIAINADGDTAMLVTGGMANNGSVTTTIDGLSTMSATIPRGYTSGGTVSLTSAIEERLSQI